MKVKPTFVGDEGYRLGFCPTGPGGGVDNSCGGKGEATFADRSKVRQEAVAAMGPKSTNGRGPQRRRNKETSVSDRV